MVAEQADAVFESPASGLRVFLETSAAEDAGWGTDDLRAVLHHQWTAPLAVDLAAFDADTANRLGVRASSQGLLLRSFGDLLTHENPPIELLILTKDFAKRSLLSPLSSLPHDVARVLYFASIAVAVSRCGHRITALSNRKLAIGMRWCLSQAWLNDGVRAVLTAGLACIEQESETEKA